MPIVRLETTEQVPPDRKASLCASLSRICAATIGKGEQWQMTLVSDGLAMTYGGKAGPAAFVDIRSIGGLTPEVNTALSQNICRLLEEELRIPPGRVYLVMANVRAEDWGHDGGTFG